MTPKPATLNCLYIRQEMQMIINETVKLNAGNENRLKYLFHINTLIQLINHFGLTGKHMSVFNLFFSLQMFC